MSSNHRQSCSSFDLSNTVTSCILLSSQDRFFETEDAVSEISVVSFSPAARFLSAAQPPFSFWIERLHCWILNASHHVETCQQSYITKLLFMSSILNTPWPWSGRTEHTLGSSSASAIVFVAGFWPPAWDIYTFKAPFNLEFTHDHSISHFSL